MNGGLDQPRAKAKWRSDFDVYTSSATYGLMKSRSGSPLPRSASRLEAERFEPSQRPGTQRTIWPDPSLEEVAVIGERGAAQHHRLT